MEPDVDYVNECGFIHQPFFFQESRKPELESFRSLMTRIRKSEFESFRSMMIIGIIRA